MEVALLAQLGERIRQLRIEKGMTIETLAERAGISVGLLSQLERGIGNPTFVTIAELAKALGVSGGYFFDLIERNADPVVRKDARKQIRNARGTLFDLLTPDTGGSFEVLLEELQPGAVDSSPYKGNTEPYTHAGEELVYVLSGQYRFYYGEHTYDLNEGDAITFRGVIPHWGENMGDVPCKLLLVICPPAF